MINRNKFILFLLFLLIIAMPVSFAGYICENTTCEVIGDNVEVANENLTISNSDDEEILGANEVYFDASASSGGDGSQSRPYNTVSSSNLGVNNHLAPGTYRVGSSLSAYSSDGITFIGADRDTTIIQFTGSDVFITSSYDIKFSTITLKNCNIESLGGSVNAINTVFDSGKAKEHTESDNYKYGNSYGGAIKKSASTGIDWSSIFGGSSSAMTFDKCIFRNNYAAYGGAIYAEKCNVTINNSRFEKNHADNGGGAIAALNGVNLIINNCEFVEDYSLYDAGGAVYIFNCSDVNIKDSQFDNCSAALGGAISSILSITTIEESEFNSNNVVWTGGAVFGMYGKLTSKNSDYSDNSAYHGGAIYADNLTYFEVNGGTFQKNRANGTAGAIFAFSNVLDKITNPKYVSNSAGRSDDLYQTDSFDLVIGSDDYEMIQYVSSYTGSLPSKFDLRTQNAVTPVKDQGITGNCWAYSTMAILESAILKATGKQVILSEGNLKNLACFYSDIGWKYDVNSGGKYPFSIGYLTSWAGPVLASLDPTDDYDIVAPILNSAVHIQNILFLQRTSYTDNNAIKKAIMDYGAVGSELFWETSYLNGNNYYYSGSNDRNHAVCVVGWDDTKSISGAPGAGAWIVKNSYGSHRGEGGYYYVSYYDKSLFRLYDDPYNSFAVVFNDTIRFNKNYQYDVAFTDYFITPTFNKAMWYKNTFTSTGNDILSAFSSYFKKVTNWQAEIYVNEELKTTQSGQANPGYWTINLAEEVPLKLGDNFTISLKIECSSTADIPISEYGPAYTMVKEYFKPGVSYFSYDGKTWTDFYGYTATVGSGSSGHNYFNQVACLKAFTKTGPTELLNTSIEIIGVNSNGVTVSVKDQNGGLINIGDVEIVVDGVKQTVGVFNSLASLNTYLKSGHHSISADYIKNQYYNASSTSKTVNLAKEDPIISISADDIVYGQDLHVKVLITNAAGQEIVLPVNVEINGQKYSQNQLEISNLSPESYIINVQSEETGDFNAKSSSKSVTVSKATSELELEISDVEIGEKININLMLSNNITGVVDVVINGSNYPVNVNNGEGSISIANNLSAGQYSVNATFKGNNYYLHTTSIKSFDVNKVTPNLSLFDEDILEGENATIILYLPSDINDTLYLSINSRLLCSSASNGMVVFSVSELASGKNDYSIRFNGNSKYLPSSISGSVEVLENSKKDVNLTVSDNVVDGDVVINVNLPEDVLGNVTLIFNSLFLTQSLIEGKTSFNINDLENNIYNYTITFAGDLNYKSAIFKGFLTVNKKTIVDLTIKSDNMTRAYLSGTDYQARFYDADGNPLDTVEVMFIINQNEYYSKTNKYGIAKLNGKFGVGSYLIKIVNPVTGENTTKTMTIVDRIYENKDIVMDYSSGTVFKVRVYGDNSQVVGEGEVVKFLINGKIHQVKTDKNGYATLKLDLTPKTYSITTEYRGVKVSNKIVVKQILKAKNAKFKKAKKVKKYKVTLKTSAGKAIKGKKITLKVKGKTLKAKTNAKGVATFKIKHLKKVGKFKAKIKYLKTSIKKTIKIKK